jgi:hypothetical protein
MPMLVPITIESASYEHQGKKVDGSFLTASKDASGEV